jgi:alkylhydroperoxidase/carboxymuconolactone decarboxylase family protein YurZ
MALLTPERLLKISYSYPLLLNSWYLVACACLTVVNEVDEIPKVLHFALRQQLVRSDGFADPNKDIGGNSRITDSRITDSRSESRSDLENPLTNKYLLQLASDSISSAAKYQDLTTVGVKLPDVLIPYGYYEKLPLKFNSSEDIHNVQFGVASKLREVILKCSALAGLPKTINGLMLLRGVTPSSIQPGDRPLRPPTVLPGRLRSSVIVGEDAEGTLESEEVSDDSGEYSEAETPRSSLKSKSRAIFDVTDTIDGPISPSSISTHQIQADLARGSDFWNTIYSNKINTRVRRQMFVAYPDLWTHAFQHVYAPLLSFTDILSARETSMCVVACLIPQDVLPQLKGHWKGAQNVGVSKEELDQLRSLVLDICEWSGVKWKEGLGKISKL